MKSRMLQEQNKLILYILSIKLCYGTYKNYDNTLTLKKVIEFFFKENRVLLGWLYFTV